MWYVLTVSQVGDMARFEWNLLSVNIHSKSYKVSSHSCRLYKYMALYMSVRSV